MSADDLRIRMLDGLPDDDMEAVLRGWTSTAPGFLPLTVGDWRRLVEYLAPDYEWSPYADKYDDDAVDERVEAEALTVVLDVLDAVREAS